MTSTNEVAVEIKDEPIVSTSFNNAFQNFLRTQNRATRVPSNIDSDEMNMKEINGEYDIHSNDVQMNECQEKNENSQDTSLASNENTHFNYVDHLVVNDNSVEINGKNEFRNYCKSTKRKRDDDDDSSNAEIRFNEDLLCQHGRLILQLIFIIIFCVCVYLYVCLTIQNKLTLIGNVSFLK